MAEPDLWLSQILASWQSRLRAVSPMRSRRSSAWRDVAPDMSIAMPGLVANANKRIVATSSDGIANTYVAFAVTLRTQDVNEFSLILLRMALDLRPDYAAARLLIADILTAQQHPAIALAVLTDDSDLRPDLSGG